ncbi:DNA polymerase IV 2 [Nymphon striatum]|nr:DNA polymerase IV 2 [Nymphon striatum]
METVSTLRKIIHVDMDAFYASVEQLDNPELRGKPIAVGGSSERGVVSAASYEARKFGVRSAMSSVIAKRNCPELIFVKNPLSLDEAYLDVTVNKKGNPSATLIAQEIRKRIYDELNLTASAVRGIHNSEVKPHRIPKSVGAERTFSENLSSEVFMLERLEQIASELERRLKKSKIAGKTITLKIKV